MKPIVLDGSVCRRSPLRVATILVLLVFLSCFSLILFSSVSVSADDQTPKAVRRSSSESGTSIKDQRRVALVIGNSDYKIHPLQNPAHDAEDISGVLRNLGFSVQTKVNVDHRGMEEAVNKFVQEIQNGDVALFYFSGHGVQVKGENFLIPLDDSMQMEADVRFKTLNAGLVLAKMEESRNRTNIVILDACRNNPFKGLFRSASTGLSKMDAPKGTFIAYATSPDSVAADGTGRNSPYTKYLMQALTVKDISIAQAFTRVANAVDKETAGQQTPWILSSLLNDFYFYPSSPTSSLGKPTEGGKTEGEQEVAKLREAERVAALERKRLEKAKREHEQEIARLREAEKVAALEKERLERGSLEREKREREQELAKLREAQRVATLEKERFEKEKQQLLTRVSPPQPVSVSASEYTRQGDVYFYGWGVPKNYDEAAKLLQESRGSRK